MAEDTGNDLPPEPAPGSDGEAGPVGDTPAAAETASLSPELAAPAPQQAESARGGVGLSTLIPILAAGFGLLGLLAGAAFWVGLQMNAGLQDLLGEPWNQWMIRGPLAGGAALVLFAVVFAFDRVLAFLTPRRLLIGLNVFVMSALALTALVLVNYQAHKHTKRIDATVNRLYSLSDQTLKVLDGLETQVKVYVFLVPGTSRHYDQVKEMLRRYGAVTEQLDVDFVNRDTERQMVELLIKKFKLESFQDYNVVVFEHVASGRSKHVDETRLREGAGPQAAFKGEELFTAAILSVVEETQPQIYFTTGHGERGIDEFRQGGLADLAKILRKQNITVGSLALADSDTEVPEDAAALIVARPSQPFTPGEIKKLQDYVSNERGGRLLVLFDPMLRRNVAGDGFEYYETGIEGLLRDFGMETHPSLIVKKLLVLQDGGVFATWLPDVLVTDFPNHPITAPFQASDARCGFYEALPLKIGTPKNAAHKVTAIASTDGKEEFAVKDVMRFQQFGNFMPEDEEGPFHLALAMSSDAPPGAEPVSQTAGPRIVVFGDSDFVANQPPEAGAASLMAMKNYELFQNSLNWLIQREKLITIEAKKPQTVAFAESRAVLALFAASACFLMPALCVGIGGMALALRHLR